MMLVKYTHARNKTKKSDFNVQEYFSGDEMVMYTPTKCFLYTVRVSFHFCRVNFYMLRQPLRHTPPRSVCLAMAQWSHALCFFVDFSSETFSDLHCDAFQCSTRSSSFLVCSNVAFCECVCALMK